MKVQVKDGVITLRSVPENYTHEDGSTTLGYNLLTDEELKRDGWVDLVEEIPVYNVETQHLELDSEIIEADSVIVRYKAVDNPAPTTPQPSVEDYMIDLDYRISKIELGV